jgi:hypothetical protein
MLADTCAAGISRGSGLGDDHGFAGLVASSSESEDVGLSLDVGVSEIGESVLMLEKFDEESSDPGCLLSSAFSRGRGRPKSTRDPLNRVGGGAFATGIPVELLGAADR